MLELTGVVKRVREGSRERTILDEIALSVEPGELVGVWGPRRAGKSTLLLIASGIVQPDAGTVTFEGEDLSRRRDAVLGTGIGYVNTALRGSEEQGVLEQVGATAIARGAPLDDARERARQALARADASATAAMRIGELAGGELLRVAIARTLVLSPALVIADEPGASVSYSERDEVFTTLRSLASGGTAVLVSSSAPEELAGFGRVLSLGEGKLRGPLSREPAPVVPLRRPAL